MVHWRFHALSVDSQPVLMFFAGGFGLFAAGASFYDQEYCEPDSLFQFEAMFSVLIAVAALLIYLFLRSDVWIEERNRQAPMPMDQVYNEGPEAPRPIVRQRLHSNLSQLSTDGEIVRRPTTTHPERSGPLGVLRRTTENVVNSRLITPENGFSASQIRLAELVIGGLLTGFVVAVIYITFSGAT